MNDNIAFIELNELVPGVDGLLGEVVACGTDARQLAARDVRDAHA